MTITAHSCSDNWGLLHHDEIDFLIRLVRDIKEFAPLIINLGAGVGTSGLTFLEARPDTRVVTVDIQSTGHPLGSLENERITLTGSVIPETRWPEQICSDSAQAGKNWNREMVDMVFVDASHSKEAVERDILAWLPHLKMGGIIAFHDYAVLWPWLCKVVDFYMTDTEYWKCLGQVDSVIAYKKLEERKERESDNGKDSL